LATVTLCASKIAVLGTFFSTLLADLVAQRVVELPP
jgi:hypothetical protein